MEIFNDEHFNLVFVFTKIKKSKLIPINYLLKEKVISEKYINFFSKKIDIEINKAISSAKKNKFPKQFNFKLLNNNNKLNNKKINTISTNIKLSSLSKKKIIGY